MTRNAQSRSVLVLHLALWALVVAAGSPMSASAGDESRIKDLAFLEGTTQEPLVGYGLVVGLNGTGDSPIARSCGPLRPVSPPPQPLDRG